MRRGEGGDFLIAGVAIFFHSGPLTPAKYTLKIKKLE